MRLAVLALALSGPCSANGDDGSGSRAPGGAPGVGELREVSLASAGEERRYFVYTPKAYEAGKGWPLVLVLHGGGGSAKGASESSLTTDAAETHGFIAVYPEGTGTTILGKTLATWNAGTCCGEAKKKGIDDVAFIGEVLDDVSRSHNVDTARVFTTGISNGGMMSERLACELPGRIAAFAAVASPGYADCKATQPVAALIIHGTEDQCALFEGGSECGGCFERAVGEALGTEPRRRSFPCVGAEDTASRWRTRNQCKPATKATIKRGAASCVESAGCAGGMTVGLCVLDGGGHTWPGQTHHCREGGRFCEAFKKISGPINQDIDANDVILQFFARHRR